MTTGTGSGGPSGAVMAPAGAAAYPLSWLLAAVALVGAVATVAFPDLLRGPAVMVGSARGTALVMAIAAVPLLVGALLATRRGSARAVPLWLGAIAYLAYNAVMLLLGTPFNPLFLLYDATLGLAIWCAITLLHRVDLEAFARRVTPGVAVRWVAVLLWVVVALNAMAWLSGVIPGMAAEGTPAFLVGTGLTTLPTYVQDLAFWLPTIAVAAWWLWRDRPWGYLVSTAMVTYFVLEAVGIAVDQTWGHAADPSSSVVAPALVPAFVVLALVCAVPLAHLLRHIHREPVAVASAHGT